MAREVFTTSDFATGTNGSQLALFDFDGDGDLDLFQVAGSPTRVGYTFLNDGSGGFTQDSTFATQTSVIAENPFVFDYNGDGIDDIVYGDILSFNVYAALVGSEEVSAVADLSVQSAEASQDLIDIIDQAIERVTSSQVELAISSEVLGRQQNYNLLLSEDLTEAKQSIEAADFALETAQLVQAQILQQAQVAALTQANSQLQVVLALLDPLS